MPFYSIASLTVEADALPNSYQPFLLGEESPGKPDFGKYIPDCLEAPNSGHR